jgi:pSer/pThr/pTyr-binding forkhead associated (FHA) protein
VTQGDHDPAADITSVFTSGLISGVEPDTVEEQLSGVEGLTPGTALLVVKRGPNAGSRFTLERDQVSAGRHPESDIFLDDVSVSRRHAEFRRVAEGYEVVDVGSLNGTYVNREAIESASLTNGDEIQIGKFRLVYLSGGRADAAPAS